MFLFILLLCCFSSSVGALLLYNTEPKFKLLVDEELAPINGELQDILLETEEKSS